MPRKLLGTAIAANTITTTQLETTVITQIESGGGPRVTSLAYPGNDLAANTGGGDSIVIRGSGFGTNVQVYINNSLVPSLVRNNANAVTITTAAQSPGTYLVYLVNTDDGGTAILVPGIQYSGTPTWVSTSPLPDQNDTWNISLSATGDSPIIYSLQEGSSLPGGITLAANGLISGTMTSPPAELTTYNFTVVATDPELQDTPKTFSVSVSIGDPYFYLTTLLLPGNGANNQTNHTFLDSSNNNFTITRNGNASQGTFSPFSQTGWGNYFNGSSHISVADNNALDLGTGDFTIEGWVYIADGVADNAGIVSKRNASGFNTGDYRISYRTGTSKISFANDTVNERNTPVVQKNTWTHFAIVRASGTLSAYANGVRGDTVADSVNLTNAEAQTIGVNATIFFTGYISNIRIVKGTAVYSGATYTVPTAPLTAISNTSLLTCQSNRFIDSGGNAFALTISGTPSIQAFSPFNPTAAWIAATNGGSGYFDGSGDYLTVPDNTALEMGSSDFTIECWFYPLALPADALIADFGSQGAQGSLIPFYCQSSSVVYYISSGGGTWNIASGVSFGGTLRIGQWHHLALVRNGNTYTPYFNGVAGTTTTNSAAINDAAVNKFIGSATTGTAAVNGYIFDFRVVKGTAVYTAAFTPPTAPLTAITNTSLLLNYTNAGITDATSKNILETVGDAKISTVQSKFGGSSILFDGTGDWLFIRSNPLMNFGTGDFTIEFWMYPVASTGDNGIWDSRNADLSATGFTVSYTDNEKIQFYSDTQKILGTITVSLNTWTHIAVTRSGTSLRLFVNGVLDGNVSNSQNFTDTNITIGRGVWSNSEFEGYIDDFRVTKGYARYTANFTPPTSALQLR